MINLFSVDQAFGLGQEEIDRLCIRPVGRSRFAPIYSTADAVYLAAGLSLKIGRLAAIRFPSKDKVTAWPLLNVERQCRFVLSFRFDANWRPIAWAAQEVSFLFSICELSHLARTDEAYEWAGYAGLAFDQGWLETGPPIFNGRFRTSYRFADALLKA
jgi:hypothetical protein